MDPADRLDRFAVWINDRARHVLLEDGGHAAMFLLMKQDGGVDVERFQDEPERPVGRFRARAMADAVRRTNADAIALISEAWSAPEDSMPEGRGAGDSTSARDILLVAAIDRNGRQIVFETAIHRGTGDSIDIDDSRRFGPDYSLGVFDEVRAIWTARAHPE